MKDGKDDSSMYVVEVVPITRSMNKSTLSYFTSAKLFPGNIVKIPIRKSYSPAVVISTKDAQGMKTDLKSASFSLKKIKKTDVLKTRLSRAFIKAAAQTAKYHATTEGQMLSSLMPSIILNDLEYFFSEKGMPVVEEVSREPLLLQLNTEERYSQYSALVRQAFARGNSVLFVVPTNQDAKKTYEVLSKGIKEFTYLFYLTKTKKSLKETWQKARDSKHPVLFITTPSGLSFEREDLDTIVLERENSRSYHTFRRPHTNFKIFLEYLAKESKRQLVLGDSVLSVETLWREKKGEASELSPIRWRLETNSITTLVDMKKDKPTTTTKEEFEIFSPELKKMISLGIKEKKGVFLFGARKGLLPTTVCNDCGSVLPCEHCGSPLVLHRDFYACHSCGHRRDKEVRCKTCHSWNLHPLGIGVDRIADEAVKLFPDTKIYVLDKNHAPTDTKAKAIAEKFKDTGGILIGTELALFHLEKVPYVGAVSLDALFSIPDMGIEERVFYLLSHLREIGELEAVIQTRNIGKQVLAWASQGNILDFYKAEIKEREQLLYPPFSVFIKVTSNEIRDILEEFHEWKPDLIGDSMIIRVKRKDWPDETLVNKLSLLTPNFLIKVDPDSLL